MPDSYDRLKKLSTDKIEKSTTVIKEPEYGPFIYFLLITMFIFIILYLF